MERLQKLLGTLKEICLKGLIKFNGLRLYGPMEKNPNITSS